MLPENNKEPKISVITVVRDAVSTIESTIQSVIAQSYLNIEYVVIDSASTDGTLEIINKYSKHFAVSISENDEGVYFAMNKALNVASGEWILYMNAGDEFAHHDVVSDVVPLMSATSELVYGDVYVCDGKSERLIKANLEGKLFSEMPFCHQSLFVKAEVLKVLEFNTEYAILADYLLILTCFQNNRKFQYVDIPISKYLLGGFSYANQFQMYVEGVKILLDVAKKDKRVDYKNSVYYVGLKRMLCADVNEIEKKLSTSDLLFIIYSKLKKRILDRLHALK